MIKKTISAALASMMFFGQAAFAAQFTDIEKHWAKTSITELADRGVVNGVTDTMYMPDKEVTRAQYLKMIMEATGLKTTPVRTGECLDATAKDWFGPYLQKALDCGLIPESMVAAYKENVDYTVDDNGKATYTHVTYSGAFNGNLPITRQEMAVLTQYVYQYTRTILTNKPVDISSVKPFADSDKISDWAYTSVKQAVANGFIDGMDNNMFNPSDTATRGQSATVILRVINKIENK